MSDESSGFLQSDPPPLTSAELALADRYVAGECSAGDLATVLRYIETDPARWGRVHALREAFAARAANGGPIQPAAEARLAFWERLASSQAESAVRPVFRVPSSAPKGIWFRASRAAALGGVAAAALAAILVYGARGDEHSSRGIAPRSYATAPGQRATVTLADGSVVRLGPATVLRVTENDMDVDGEAMFTVAPQSRAPFVVRTGNTVTRVLGTRFVVRKYRSDRASRIIVADGRVSVSVNGTTSVAILGAGTQATVTGAGTIDVARGIIPQEQTTLIDERFVFRDAPLADVVSELARSYGIEMRIADSALARRTVTFTASVASESLADVLDFLSTALDAHYTRAGRTVTFVSGARASARPRRSPLRMEAQYGR